MFGKSKVKKIKPNRVSTVIGQETEIHGNVLISGGLHIDGIIKGNVSAESGSGAILSLSELGTIEGDVYVPLVILNGTVKGNVFAAERIELAPNAKVAGNVTYKLIEMSVGAEVNGRLLHQNEPPLVKVAKKNEEPNAKPTPRPKRLGKELASSSVAGK